GALGDYSASTHLQGEVLGTMLDFIVRDATAGRRSMDDVMRVLFDSSATTRIDGRTVERVVEHVCACDVTPFFDAYVRGAGTLEYNRYLGLMGLRASVTWEPAVYNGEPERDLRIFGWEPADGGVRLVITSPASIWGKAGLHSGDRVTAMDGAAVTTWADLRARLQRLRMGDTVHIAIQRAGGSDPFTTTVVVSGFERPVTHIAGDLNATGKAWVDGR
ncbi:MAG TPA: PDZ domain-containing protein, partial [Gemmatimonadales bacterium]|nr:PDZ domain-containing protein [Gemmatimonadales bacterium]